MTPEKTLSVSLAASLVRAYLNGRALPDRLHDAMVREARARLVAGKIPVLDAPLCKDIDDLAAEKTEGATRTTRQSPFTCNPASGLQPAVEITRCGERLFNAYVGTGRDTRWYAHEELCSVAECLQDAAAALGTEFRYATVVFDNMTAGSYPIAALAHRAVEVADELVMRRSGWRGDA